MKNKIKTIVFVVIFIINYETKAIEPDEILQDQILENRAKDISKELRCLVCQNEDIQNSNADIAKDLRKIVRIKLEKGESKEEIMDFIHSKYGDFVLFSPPLRFDTAGLWFLPISFSILLAFYFFRKR